MVTRTRETAETVGKNKRVDWVAAQKLYDAGFSQAIVARKLSVGRSLIELGVKFGYLSMRSVGESLRIDYKKTTKNQRRKRMAAAIEASSDPESVAKRIAGRMRSDYVTSGRSAAQARINGSTNKLPDDEAAIRVGWSHYKRSARLRGYVFRLSLNTFRALVTGRCWYCDAPPSSLWATRAIRDSRRTGDVAECPINGIDRVDNARGYVPNNSVSCCGPCNKAKRTMSAEAFIALAKAIVKLHGNDTRTERDV